MGFWDCKAEIKTRKGLKTKAPQPKSLKMRGSKHHFFIAHASHPHHSVSRQNGRLS
jgi:hypothetical protein